MRIVTTPGSNLSDAAIARYGIHVTPHRLVVDDVSHDARDGIPFDEIDRWVRTARTRPYVVGTSAAEFVSMFRELAKREKQLVAVMTSRKIIGSHDAALSAAKALRGHSDADIRVVDSSVTDLGTGLACVLAAEARNAGQGIDAIVALLETYAKHAMVGVVIDSLEYMMKGGRAMALRATLASLLGIRPLIGFVDGELKVVAKESAKAEPGEVVAKWLATTLRPGDKIALCVMHAGRLARASSVVAELKRKYDVRYVWTRPLAPSVYLHSGPGAVAFAAVPIDALPWWPSSLPEDLG